MCVIFATPYSESLLRSHTFHAILSHAVKDKENFLLFNFFFVFSTNIQQHLNLSCDVSCDNKRKNKGKSFLVALGFLRVFLIITSQTTLSWRHRLKIFLFHVFSFLFLIRISANFYFLLLSKSFMCILISFVRVRVWVVWKEKREISEWNVVFD